MTVALSGGVGNQLFQYATARRLAERNGAALVLDHLSFFRGDFYQARFALGAFRVQGQPIDSPPYLTKIGRGRRKLERAVNRRLPLPLRFFVHEADLCSPDHIVSLQLWHDVYLDGTWQHEQNFADVRANLLAELELRDAPDEQNRRLADTIRSCVSGGVHVRRLRGRPNTTGSQPLPDNPDLHVPVDYYARAIRHLESLGVEHLFVFADYVPWVEQHIRSRVPVTLVSHNAPERDHLDLWLMKQCAHFVLANSTFGWWGAWLGARPGKCVIVPGDYLRVDRGLVSVPADWLSF